jgi:succinate dehydrogenase / fumarate reductase flavoprotein subunit
LINELINIKSNIEFMGIEDKSKYYNKNLIDFLEFKNVLDLSIIVAKCALFRKESRGSHYRLDFPIELEYFQKNTIIKKENDEIKLELEDIL